MHPLGVVEVVVALVVVVVVGLGAVEVVDPRAVVVVVRRVVEVPLLAVVVGAGCAVVLVVSPDAPSVDEVSPGWLVSPVLPLLPPVVEV